MYKKDLKPNEENIKNTFLNDAIGRNEDLAYFIKILASINSSYSIAVDSDWGSGKTFFVKQIKMILDASNDFSYDAVADKDEVLNKWEGIPLTKEISIHNQVAIYYDAWENDSDGDPIYSLIYKILSDAKSNEGLTKKITFDDILEVAGKITEAIAGVNPNEIAESLKSRSFLDDLKEKKTVEEMIKQLIDGLLPEHGDRLVIIIDELDRCNPKFAVKLLERIKHYFDNDKVTFVFSTNLSELQHTVKNYYGADFSAGKYLDRFFDLRISLPAPDLDKFYESIGHFDLQRLLDIPIKLAVNKYKMQLREISKYIVMLKSVSADINCIQTSDINNIKFIILMVLNPICIALKITDPKKHSDFISGKDNSPLVDFYSDKENLEEMSRYLTLLYSNSTEFLADNITDIQIQGVQKVLKDFYDKFFNQSTTEKIGKCMIQKTDREYFFKINSLLTNSAITELDAAEEEI